LKKQIKAQSRGEVDVEDIKPLAGIIESSLEGKSNPSVGKNLLIYIFEFHNIIFLIFFFLNFFFLNFFFLIFFLNLFSSKKKS